jgi:hypothetical protein
MKNLLSTVGKIEKQILPTNRGPSGAKARINWKVLAARVELVPFPLSVTQALCKALCLLGVLGLSMPQSFALDREAFTFTNYDLRVQIDPEQHRLGVRGKVTLRNDSQTPQKIAVLQISSSLDWRSIKAGEKAVQFVTQPYASDIDHTGALSEAIVTLPQPVVPQGTIDLDIAYEGVILPDATRLTRIGAPEDAARSSDWDEIGATFTALRGAGYVAWYPIATDVANLSEGDSLFGVLARWKAREKEGRMEIGFSFPDLPGDASSPMILCGGNQGLVSSQPENPKSRSDNCSYPALGLSVPAFVVADFQLVQRPAIDVYYLHDHEASAANYADEAQKIVPFIADWFGKPRQKATTADLPDPNAAPFESGALLLAPLANPDSKLAGLTIAHQLTHAAFVSFRPWINEGLAHFAQALYVEREKGRQTALDYMGLHRTAFAEAEKANDSAKDDSSRSLINTTSEEFYRSKAMCVWWMLRDMVGDAALKKALAAYRAEDDQDQPYLQKLIEKASQRDLQWFFDDWVYHDRGLPDFKVDSAFPVKTPSNGYIITVTVTNSGGAGAEVPVIVKSTGGDTTVRLEVRAKSKAVTRIEVSGIPQEIVVNDGSVPESDITNNVFKLEAASTSRENLPQK